MVLARKRNVLLCISGSVATIKVPEIVVKLKELYEVRIICSSSSAMHFLSRSENYQNSYYTSFLQAGGYSLIVSDTEEWELWNKMGDIVLHIELRKWADVVLIAPASANLIAKISCGISDGLLACVLRAIDAKSKPCIICPAMNTMMWSHPVTTDSLDKLRSWGYIVLEPVVKKLACHDIGKGALAKVDDIVELVTTILSNSKLSTNDNSNNDLSSSDINDSTQDNNDNEKSVFLDEYFQKNMNKNNINSLNTKLLQVSSSDVHWTVYFVIGVAVGIVLTNILPLQFV